ncbi:MAG TPA: tyrosine-type recombinase/integrase [Propionibacteriaceae bacterium]|nr:tyrosine-type recombinase/integrase [Propionibacteriaceae bacterium]
MSAEPIEVLPDDGPEEAVLGTFGTASTQPADEGAESVPLPRKSGTKAAKPAPPTNKGRKLAPEPLRPEEVRQLAGAISNRSTSGVRLRGMIGVMFGAGLRLAECLALYPRDIDTTAGIIRVREGKGRKDRTIGIDAYSCALVDRWLDRRRKLGLTARHPLFATYSKGRFGGPLQQRYVRAALVRAADRADMTQRVHPHGLRHSLASDMADRGEPTHVIQAQLGHGSLATTDRYIRRLRPMEVIKVMRGRDWSKD